MNRAHTIAGLVIYILCLCAVMVYALYRRAR